MNATQKQAASVLLAAAYKASGTDMAKVADVLEAAQKGDPVACNAIAVDCLRLAAYLEERGDPRYATLLALAAELAGPKH